MTKKTTKKTTKSKPKQTKKGTGTKQKRNGTVTVSSDLTKVRKTAEYLGFLQFMATPQPLWPELYGVTNQMEYAKQIGVDNATLSDWKNVPGFYDDVVTINKKFFKARVGNVMLALETKCLDPNKVTGNDARVFATYAEAYSDKVEEEHKLDPAVQEALAKVAKALG